MNFETQAVRRTERYSRKGSARLLPNPADNVSFPQSGVSATPAGNKRPRCYCCNGLNDEGNCILFFLGREKDKIANYHFGGQGEPLDLGWDSFQRPDRSYHQGAWGASDGIKRVALSVRAVGAGGQGGCGGPAQTSRLRQLHVSAAGGRAGLLLKNFGVFSSCQSLWVLCQVSRI